MPPTVICLTGFTVYKFKFQLFATTALYHCIHLWLYFKLEETLNLFFLSLSEKLLIVKIIRLYN